MKTVFSRIFLTSCLVFCSSTIMHASSCESHKKTPEFTEQEKEFVTLMRWLTKMYPDTEYTFPRTQIPLSEDNIEGLNKEHKPRSGRQPKTPQDQRTKQQRPAYKQVEEQKDRSCDHRT